MKMQISKFFRVTSPLIWPWILVGRNVGEACKQISQLSLVWNDPHFQSHSNHQSKFFEFGSCPRRSQPCITFGKIRQSVRTQVRTILRTLAAMTFAGDLLHVVYFQSVHAMRPIVCRMLAQTTICVKWLESLPSAVDLPNLLIREVLRRSIKGPAKKGGGLHLVDWFVATCRACYLGQDICEVAETDVMLVGRWMRLVG